MSASSHPFVLPSSSSIVSVKLFNAFRNLVGPSSYLWSAAPGSSADEGSVPLSCSGKSFLVEHAPSGKKIIFDLGMSSDVESMIPLYRDLIKKGTLKMEFGPSVAETLTGVGIDLASIDAMIWSHMHNDHSGNPSTFPSTTKVVVGPGTQAHFRPGYPLNPDSHVLESDFLGREIVEIEYPKDGTSINGMKAFDYFGDGSFYLLDAPGHFVGHLVGLARTTPTTFVLMGADVAHHPAMLRPSLAHPLPSSLEKDVPSSLEQCARNAPFLAPPPKSTSIHHDHDTAVQTLHKIIEFDAHPDVFVVLSHDVSMDGVDGLGGGEVPWFPEPINKWKEKGVKDAVRWKFLEKGNEAYRW